MKKIISFILLSGLLVIACKARKNSAKAASTEPGDAQLAAVKTKIPNATMDDLKQGHGIFYSACTRCHGAKNVTGYSEEKLKTVIDKMASRAKLSDTEKDEVWKYVLAVNLSAKK